MNDIEAKNLTVIEALSSKSKRAIICSYNIFEISNGELKVARNPQNGKIISLRAQGDAMDWVADFGDQDKLYTVLQCFHRPEQ